MEAKEEEEEAKEEEEEERADKSHSVFHHTDYILHSALMGQGSKPGWRQEIYGR